MNWYKQAQSVNDLNERTRINSQIRKLETIAVKLNYAAKLVYQTQRGARELIAPLTAHKTLSSYPIILDALAEADSAAMDSPQRFAEACFASIEEIGHRIVMLKKQRRALMHPDNSHKGL